MPVGEEVMINDTPTNVHHMDDQGSWENDPILHPQFIPGPKPKEGERPCLFGHSHDTCLCHCELREHGQDESIYCSGDHPASRWAVDGRSYPISKSQSISKMVSAFKDYSKRGMGLIMSANELTQVNLQRVGNFYANADSTPMP